MSGRDDVNAETAMSTGRAPSSGVATLGWALGALVVAVAMSFAANILFVDVLDAAIDPFTGGAVVPEWIEAVGTALLVGGAIGGVIGSRVGPRAVAIAVGVTVLYLLMWPFAVFLARGLLLPVAAVLHVVAATLVANWMQRRTKTG